MSSLSFHHLRYFWTVAQTGSVTLAARKLHISQPSVSAQLKQLERTLGERLFERQGRGLVLTDAGRIAFEYATKIFSLGDELVEAMHGGEIKHLSTLRVGIADVIPKSLAYRFIEPGLDANSGCVLTCVEDKTERLLADLSVGELDLVIADRSIPPNVKVKAFNHFIGESPVAFLGSKAMKKRFGSKFPESLASAPLLLPTNESSVRHELDKWFDELRISPNPIAEIQDRALMKIAARHGQGIVPIPIAIEREVQREYGLHRIGVADTVQERLYMITLERRMKNPLLLRIASQARATLFSRG